MNAQFNAGELGFNDILQGAVFVPEARVWDMESGCVRAEFSGSVRTLNPKNRTKDRNIEHWSPKGQRRRLARALRTYLIGGAVGLICACGIITASGEKAGSIDPDTAGAQLATLHAN